MNKDDEEKRLINLAMRERFLGPAALSNHIDAITLIEHDGKAVGFATPFVEKDGRWRAGSIYVEPRYRGKDIAGRWIREFFKDKEGRAWIEPSNIPSATSFKKQGFVRTGRTALANGKPFDEWLKSNRPPEKMNKLISSW